MSYLAVDILKYEGILSLWDKVDATGAVHFPVYHGYISTPSVHLHHICEAMQHNGWILFSMAHTQKHLEQQANIQVIPYGHKLMVACQLAPLLGLPNQNWKEELAELRQFLVTLKNQSLDHLEQTGGFGLDSVGNKASFFVSSTNNMLGEEWTKQARHTISQSPVLTQWLENQKQSILATKGKLFDLCASMRVSDLFTRAEWSAYSQSVPQPTSKTPLKSKKKKYIKDIRPVIDLSPTIKVIDVLRAIQADEPQTLQRFLDQGLPVNGWFFKNTLPNAEGASLLCQAAASNALDCVKFLLEQGADVNELNSNGDNALFVNFHFHPLLSVAKLLVEKGINLDQKNKYGNTILFAFLSDIIEEGEEEDGQEAIASFLFQSSINTETPCEDGLTLSRLIEDLEVSDMMPNFIQEYRARMEHGELDESTPSPTYLRPSSRL